MKVKWECSGCDHLCEVSVDRSVNPNDTIRYNHGTTNFKEMEK